MEYLHLKNHLSKALLLVTALGCFSFYAKAQAPAKPADATAATAAKAAPVVKGAATLIETFFKKYKDDGTAPAVDYIFGTNKLFTNVAQINLLKVKLDSLRQSIGAYEGRELIIQKSASPSLVFYSYLVKHEYQPIRFTFIFYKAQNDWVLYRFKYDDQMDAELEEGGKINMKRP